MERNGSEGEDAGASFRNVACGGRQQGESWTAAGRRKRPSVFIYGFSAVRDERVTGYKGKGCVAWEKLKRASETRRDDAHFIV